MFAVPPSASTACWLNAWLSQRESADAVIGGLLGGRSVVHFDSLDGGARLPPALFLGQLRRHGVSQVTVALPSPGDPIGLGGPTRFNADALEAGEALLLHGAGLGLVPQLSESTIRWGVSSASPPSYLPDVATADRTLRAVLLDVTAELVALDVISWSPDAADALMNLQAPLHLDSSMSFASAEAARTAVTGLRSKQIVELTLRDEGGALTADEMTRRRQTMAPLHRAAQAAVVAACSSIDGR